MFFQEDGRFSVAYNLTGKTDDNGYYIVGHPITNVTVDLILDRSKKVYEWINYRGPMSHAIVTDSAGYLYMWYLAYLNDSTKEK